MTNATCATQKAVPIQPTARIIFTGTNTQLRQMVRRMKRDLDHSSGQHVPTRHAAGVTGYRRARVRTVDRIVQTFRSFEEADEADDQYYADLPPQQRLDILLQLIERHRSSIGEPAKRFERVHQVAELSRR